MHLAENPFLQLPQLPRQTSSRRELPAHLSLNFSVTSILRPFSSPRLNTSRSMMSAICFTSFLVSCLNTMISSRRLRNSGRK
jgi:hypothetical protein